MMYESPPRLAAHKRRRWLSALLCAMLLTPLLPLRAAQAQELPTVYHSPQHLYYQASSHKVAYQPKTFVLIPTEHYSEDWTPSTAAWSGRADANYLVAYCSDDRTSSTTQGAQYSVYTLDNSRFSDPLTQRRIAAIIGHSYPFLTREEMAATLRGAVDSGALTADVLDCTESEWIAATQWAIWSVTATTGQIGVEDVGGAAFPAGHPEKYIAPLTDVGHTDEAQIKSHIEALKNWLCTLETPLPLAVESYTHSVAPEGEDSYALTVDVLLNRAVTAEETAEFRLQVGQRTTETAQVAPQETGFTATLHGLTHAQLADARVLLTLGGKHMQAYFYDSENYQDMVGGAWERYSRDVSFTLGQEKISVAVSKVWSPQNEAAPDVTVQLYANDRAVGEAVTLSAANNWSYVWQDVCRTDLLGNEIRYTLQEKPVEGYYSRLEQVEQFTQAVPQWEETETFTADGKYLLLSPYGALAATAYTDAAGQGKDDYVTLKAVDIADGKNIPAGAVWEVKAAEDGYTLYTPHLQWYLYMGSYGWLSDKPCELQFEGGHLFKASGDTRRYFSGFYSDEAFYVSADAEKALDFKLYRLVETPLPAADINFLLTNTRYDSIPEAPRVDITVEKRWEGRLDGAYPAAATVTLLQDGRPYGGAVTLSAENGWRYVWRDMPTQVNGETVVYALQEAPQQGYESQITTETENLWGYIATNVWRGDGVTVTLHKADADTQQPLQGAVFELWQVSRSDLGDPIPSTERKGFLLGEVETDGDGLAALQLSAGEQYCLVEKRAPAGYQEDETAVAFAVERRGDAVEVVLWEDCANASAEGAALRITNCAGETLPATGGRAALIYGISGGLVLLSAACFLLSARRWKKEK